MQSETFRMGRMASPVACLLLLLVGTSGALANVAVEENTGEAGLAWVSAMPEGSSDYTVVVIDTAGAEAVERLEAIAAANGGAAWFSAADVAAAAGTTHTEKITAVLAAAGMPDGMQLPVVGFGAGADVAMVLAFEGWPVVVAMGPDLSISMPSAANSTSKLLVVSEYDPSENVTALEIQLDAAGVEWETIRLAPDNSTEQEMQMRAMHKMLTFLAVGGVTAGTMNPGMSPAGIDMEIPFMYDDGSDSLEGYLAVPEGIADSGMLVPAVVILPDWSGLDAYELERANMLAMDGYVSLAANIYGLDANYTVASFADRGSNATYWRTNWDLYITRIRAAIDAVKALPYVNDSKVALIGYCFGGSGAIYEALDSSELPVVVSFHGGISEPRIIVEGERATSAMVPYMSVQSGGSDESVEDIDWLLESLAAKPGNWDLTRYSQVVHGFTHWGGNGYHERAEGRSWMAMMDEIIGAFGAPEMLMPPTAMVMPEGTTDISVAVIDTPTPEAMARLEMMAEAMGGAMMLSASAVVAAPGGSHTEKMMAAASSAGMSMESDVPVVGFGAGADVAMVLAFENWPVVVAVGADLTMARPADAASSSKLLTISAYMESENVTALEMDLDAAGVEWETIRLGSSSPTFFNEESSVMTRVTKKMITFLEGAGSTPGTTTPGEAPEGVAMEMPFLYMDGKDELEGYIAAPVGLVESNKMIPAVIILPDWDGLNAYELQRANMLAIHGYVGIAANIYGEAVNYTIPAVEDRMAAVGYWRTNWDLYITRIRAAIDAAKALPYVDSSKIAVIGYCFGGSGAIYEALDSSEVQVVLSYHGGISEPRVVMEGERATSELMPYLSVQSGGNDESVDDIDWLLQSLAAKPGDWDLTRYSQVVHSFTVWGHSGYNARAEGRSWMALMDEMHTAFGGSAVWTNDTLDTAGETLDAGDVSSSVSSFLLSAVVLAISLVQLVL